MLSGVVIVGIGDVARGSSDIGLESGFIAGSLRV